MSQILHSPLKILDEGKGEARIRISGKKATKTLSVISSENTWRYSLSMRIVYIKYQQTSIIDAAGSFTKADDIRAYVDAACI